MIFDHLFEQMLKAARQRLTERIETAIFTLAKPGITEAEEDIINTLSLIYYQRVSEQKFKETMKLAWDAVDSGNNCQ